MPKIIQPDILHLEACNFINKPTGGLLNFSRQLIKVLGTRLALVGWTTTSSEPIGRWFEKEIDGTVYQYFAIGKAISSSKKPLIPAQLTTWFQIKYHLNSILSINIPNIIVRNHSILMAMGKESNYNLCYYFPGVDSPLSISRYAWAKIFSNLFDILFFYLLSRKANYILAAADQSAIEELKGRAGKQLSEKKIITFPTRVDTNIFYPANHSEARKVLGLPDDFVIVITTGRIHWAKGWQFLLESFKLFHIQFPKSLLIFIGDGAEQKKLEQYALTLNLQDHVKVTGYQAPSSIATYLQSADLFLMGSLKEGWSTVLVEALACCLPIVTTSFSSADTIVTKGINGFVVERNTQEFSRAMGRALNLHEVALYSKNEIERYALKNLVRDLFKVWPVIKQDMNIKR